MFLGILSKQEMINVHLRLFYKWNKKHSKPDEQDPSDIMMWKTLAR